MIKINEKDLSEFNTWEEVKKECEKVIDTHKKIRDMFGLPFTDRAIEDITPIKEEWNKLQQQKKNEQQNNQKLHKINRQEQQNTHFLKQHQLLPKRGDKANVVSGIFKGKTIEIADVCESMQTLVGVFNDNLQNSWRFKWNEVQVIEEKWEDIIIEKKHFLYIIKENEVIYESYLDNEMVKLDFTKEQIKKLVKEYKNDNKKIVKHLLRLGLQNYYNELNIKRKKESIERLNQEIQDIADRVNSNNAKIEEYLLNEDKKEQTNVH